ncbi:MAG: ATP synthase F1 subunit epsilon [Actinomycetota bacterium]
MALSVDVVSAERRLFQGEASELHARSVDGELAILPGHAPVLLGLAVGPLRVRTSAGEEIRVAVHRGFLECRDDDINVLADTAELAEDIDVERARAARERAVERLAGDAYDGDARAELARAETRLAVAERGDGSA